jgi:class 3 adenylate cyclase/tetratricopeptide (TPR) repeat protein
MRCPHCGADNPAQMKFCGQCGRPLPRICLSCGANNPPGHKFCGHCGALLDPPGLRDPAVQEPYRPRPQTAIATGTLPGEMKQVTVLFCDIVNSTPLAERLGAEAMRDLVNRFLELSIAEIRRYGGTAPEFTGDGFMAVFGAPRAYEDHVRRALLAALGIRRALAGESAATPGANLELPVRIGIHTGPAVFGPVGGDFGTETVIGDTANVAARMQQAADPGVILLSDATWLSAQGYVRAEPVGPLAVKGKTEPIPAYRLLGVSRSRATRDGPRPAHTINYVDRADELAAMLRFAEEAESGGGRAVGIVGEPGIGKSRLVDEVRQRLAHRRVNWVEGRCDSYGTMIPYQLVLDLLRSNCGIVDADTPEEITDKVCSGLSQAGMDPDQDAPLLLYLLGIKAVEDPSLLSRPEAVKDRTFDIFRRLAINASLRRPMALVVEDLHWIDKISEEFLRYAVESLAGTRILLIATYRPDYVPPWSGRPVARQVALQPLGLEHSRQVARAVLAGFLVNQLAEDIVAKADGNPLFLEQLVLHAGEARSRRGELMVPATIHDVIMARIDRLPAVEKQLLQTAAVIGREFSLHLLNAVWSGPEPIDALLGELCRLEFLDEKIEPEGATYIFRHALTQEAAYGSLLERHRRASHARIGAALESLYEGRSDEVAELLAFHFGRGERAEKAVDYAILAAQKSQRHWANSEALTYFNDALHRLDAMPDTKPNRLRRIDAVLKQAEVKYALGQYTEQLEALEGIRGIVEDSDEHHRRATWHYWIGFLHATSGGQPDVAIEHCLEAARIASASGLEEIDAFAASCLAQIYDVAGRPRDAVASGERALASFEARGDRWWAGRTLWHLTSAANYLGDWKASLGYCRRGLDHGIALGDLRLKAAGWARMGAAYIQQGDVERGIQCCNEALALNPIPRDAAWARAVRGYGSIRAGRVDDGIEELSRALAWFENSRMRVTQVISMIWLAEGHLRRGDRATARPLIDHLLATSRATGYLQYEGRACWLMGECLADEVPATAEHYVETAMRIFERIGARNDLARAMATRAALREAAGDVAAARRLLGEAYAIFKRLGTRDEQAKVAAMLTALAQSVQARN